MFFLIFSQASIVVLDLCRIYRYFTDISAILAIFSDFSKKRFSFAKIVSRWPDTRNIDDISSMFRDIFNVDLALSMRGFTFLEEVLSKRL